MNITKALEEHFDSKITFRLEHRINTDGTVNHVLYGLVLKGVRPTEVIELDVDFSILGTNAKDVSAIDADSAFINNIITQVTTEANLDRIRAWGFDV